MNDYIDLYCERIAVGLWGEPLNSLSNMAFFIAAWFIWRLVQHQHIKSISIRILIALAITVGIGSTLFHAFATRLTYLSDVIPILLFQLWFLWLYSRRIIRMNYGSSGLIIICFFFASNFARQFTDILNGSLSYAPAFLVLLGLGIYHYQQQKRDRFVLLLAGGVFLLALSCRTLDQILCSHFPMGIHFLWHILNGVLLYLSARGLVLNWSTKIE